MWSLQIHGHRCFVGTEKYPSAKFTAVSNPRMSNLSCSEFCFKALNGTVQCLENIQDHIFILSWTKHFCYSGFTNLLTVITIVNSSRQFEKLTLFYNFSLFIKYFLSTLIEHYKLKCKSFL